MEPISIHRYHSAQNIGFLGYVEPQSRRWIVFVDAKGEATLWRRKERSDLDKTDGRDAEYDYVDVELPTCRLATEDPPTIDGPELAGDNVLDYTVSPGTGPGEHDTRPGFNTWLNCRSVGCWGETEHEAVRALMNYVARLCTAGQMDQTGAPSHGNERRQQYAWSYRDAKKVVDDPKADG